jgi:hypothetical protein
MHRKQFDRAEQLRVGVRIHRLRGLSRGDDAPDADKYAEVTGDAPISDSIVEFSAFEPGAETPWPATAPMTPNADKPAAAPETHGKPQ